jgi:hypothetical protein
MRTLLIVALAATLVGCSCPLQRQASLEACPDASGFCFDGMPVSQPIEPEPSSFRPHSAKVKVKPTTAAKTEKPSSADTRDRDYLAVKTAESNVIVAKVEPPTSGRAAETADPVLIKAKTTIAAKLEDPASAEFGEMNRAVRKNVLGQSVDTICGRVKARKTSGEATGDRPFLYLVKDDEAYVVVDGSAGSAAATAYRNICN